MKEQSKRRTWNLFTELASTRPRDFEGKVRGVSHHGQEFTNPILVDDQNVIVIWGECLSMQMHIFLSAVVDKGCLHRSIRSSSSHCYGTVLSWRSIWSANIHSPFVLISTDDTKWGISSDDAIKLPDLISHTLTRPEAAYACPSIDFCI